MTFDAARHDEIIDFYSAAQTFAKAHIMPAPILMLGEDVALDPEKFVVRATRSTCWRQGARAAELRGVLELGRLRRELPRPARDGRRRALPRAADPLHETAGCCHLQFDFFRNSWVRDVATNQIRPYIELELGDD